MILMCFLNSISGVGGGLAKFGADGNVVGLLVNDVVVMSTISSIAGVEISK